MNRANNINPAILAWARETAGLDLEEAARHLGFIRPSDSETAAECLLEIERGNRKPTRNQLLKFAFLYRRPIMTFYMKQPPLKGERGEDFRRTPSSISRRDNALLDALLRDIRARQEMIKALLDDEGDPRGLPFVGSAAMDQGVLSVVESIAATLRFDYQSPRLRSGNADGLFNTLRERAESAGIFVLLIGDLGSHHTALSTEIFRGFAISDHTAPFLVIHDKDARNARSFTLLHELAHIWLNQSGVSGAPSPEEPLYVHDRTERFCNDVAGEFLLPNAALNAEIVGQVSLNKQSANTFIEGLAESWSVSRFMVAYRLNRLGHVETAIYRELIAEYTAQWKSQQRRKREQYRKSSGGPNPHVVICSKLGNALLDVVRRTLRNNTLTHTKAAKILGVKPGSVESVLQLYEKRHSSMIQGIG